MAESNSTDSPVVAVVDRDDLLLQLRAHRYRPNPAIEDHVRPPVVVSPPDSEQVMVRLRSSKSRHASGVSVSSATGAETVEDIHFDCLTPAPDGGHTNVDCGYCQMSAINGMRCTTLEERELLIDDYNDRYVSRIPHVVCYRCLANYMLSINEKIVPCPYGCGCEFNLDNLVVMNRDYTLQCNDLLRSCPDGCGLMGSSLELSVHICYRVLPTTTGDVGATAAGAGNNNRPQQAQVAVHHILQSTKLQQMIVDNKRMKDKINKLELEMDDSIGKMNSMDRDLREQLRNNEKLRHEYQSVYRRHYKLKLDFAELETDFMASQLQLTVLKDRYRIDDYRKLLIKYDNLKLRYTEADGQLRELRELNKKYKQDNHLLNQTNQRLVTKRKQLEDSFDRLQKSIDRQQTTGRSCGRPTSAGAANTTTTTDDNDQTIADLTEKLESMQNELTNYKRLYGQQLFARQESQTRANGLQTDRQFDDNDNNESPIIEDSNVNYDDNNNNNISNNDEN